MSPPSVKPVDAVDVPCSTCKAPKGEVCRVASGLPRSEPHATRKTAAGAMTLRREKELAKWREWEKGT